MSTTDRLPRWIVIWLCVGTAIVLWDISFVLLRPASLPGGSLATLYHLQYATYIKVDLGYGDVQQPFVWAQALMSLLEAFVTFGALAAHARRKLALATLLAFATSSLTCAKTVLLLLLEVMNHGRNVGHNDLATLIGYYIVPNSVWVVMPLAVAIVTGRTLVQRASFAERPIAPAPALSAKADVAT